MITAILTQVAVMFIIIAVGFICGKTRLITEEGVRQLSDLTLKLVNPILIFVTYQTDYDSELLKGLLWALLLSVITHTVSILLITFLIPDKAGRETGIERVASVYSNCGFMGIPLIGAIFGGEGIIYVTAYMTIFNLLVWTHGLMEVKGERNFRSLLFVLKSPVIIAIFLGIICFVLRLRLPEIVLTPLDHIGSMNTPLAMLVAGATISRTSLIGAVKKPRIYWICALKLLILPIVGMLILMLFPLPRVVVTTVILASACPAAATGTLFAVSCGKNAAYASELFAMTTLLSCATLPVIAFLSERLIH